MDMIMAAVAMTMVVLVMAVRHDDQSVVDCCDGMQYVIGGLRQSWKL